jgi:phosphopantothenoylcysteine synthetase/decarboxylase
MAAPSLPAHSLPQLAHLQLQMQTQLQMQLQLQQQQQMQMQSQIFLQMQIHALLKSRGSRSIDEAVGEGAGGVARDVGGTKAKGKERAGGGQKLGGGGQKLGGDGVRGGEELNSTELLEVQQQLQSIAMQAYSLQLAASTYGIRSDGDENSVDATEGLRRRAPAASASSDITSASSEGS